MHMASNSELRLINVNNERRITKTEKENAELRARINELTGTQPRLTGGPSSEAGAGDDDDDEDNDDEEDDDEDDDDDESDGDDDVGKGGGGDPGATGGSGSL